MIPRTPPIPTVGREPHRDRYFANDHLALLETLGLLERSQVLLKRTKGIKEINRLRRINKVPVCTD
jgi:hypothetical protein